MTDPAAVPTPPSAPQQLQELAGKHVLLGLSGGIACYKAAELCRLLLIAGATVQVVMTEAAMRFITPVTMQALSGRVVLSSQWDEREPNSMAHINLSRQADAIVIAPCSADFAAKLALGRADDLLSLLCLARAPDRTALLIAPAMNREMYAHPATQRNLRQLADDGATVLGVGSGAQACGETGDGRMLEPFQLLQALSSRFAPKLLVGQRVLITAGPTYEAIDPVRGLTNLSSGKMGFALARAAREAGAEVTLVTGPVALQTPEGVERIDVTSAQNMSDAVVARSKLATIFIATAAVADWRVAAPSPRKLKKANDKSPPVLQFVENPDILAAVAQSQAALDGDLYCVGFAAESHDLMANAQAKRLHKKLPLLVANIGPDTFGQNSATLVLIDSQGSTVLPQASKQTLARLLVAHIHSRLPPGLQNR